MRYFIFTLVSFMLTMVVIAQDNCSVIVEDALASVDNLCEETGRNELCYGNNLVSVTGFSGEVDFAQPGDIVSVLDIASISTSPFAEPDEWGIAVMKVQANIPDSLPGTNVTFLLFGDVNLQNAGSSSTTLSASTTSNLNIRSGPSTNHSIAGSLQSSKTIDLIGRNTAGDWVYFTTEDSSGWLFAQLLQIESDVMQLDEVPDYFEGASSGTPMQAVYFSSGIGESTCNDVPEDGILIQSPEYEQPIELIINDVEIKLGSTIYMQAEAGGEMTVSVLEGFAFVTANDETVNVPEGASTTIQIDENLQAISVPSDPEGYIREEVDTAPVTALEEEISVAESATEEDLSGYTITVPSIDVWVDTGITLSSGQHFTMSASGEANHCGTGDNPNCTGDPNIDRQVGPEGNTAFEICEGQYAPCQLMPVYMAHWLVVWVMVRHSILAKGAVLLPIVMALCN